MRSRTIALFVLAFILTTSSLLAQTEARQRALRPYRVGWENMRAEAWDQAVKSFQQALEIDPKFELAYYCLGRAQMGQKNYAEAVEAFSRSRDMYQGQAGQQFSSRQDAQRFRRDQMMELDELIRQYQQGPQTMQVQDALRQLRERRRLLEDAIQRGTNITIESSVPAFVSLSLGSAFFRLGKLTDAEREYKAAVAADPKAGEAHSNLAVVYMETGRYTDAEASVAAAEKAGFKVNPQLKQEIKERMKKRT